jgi:hypothetical protein
VKHFSITEWADFARDVMTEEQGTPMQKHLDEGCSVCAETIQTWRSVTECASHEALYDPPSSSLRIATSYFAPFKLASKQATGMRIARLTFDNFARRAHEGFRGPAQLARQLVYQVDDVFIDLRLEPKAATNQVGLVGQIADSGHTLGSVEGVVVSFQRGDDTIMQTSTNQFGEFQLSMLSSEFLQLLVRLKEITVVMSLPGPESGDKLS